MKLSRILGADMTLLFSLRFLINQTRGIKAAGRFCKYFILNCAIFSLFGQIIRIIQTTKVCGYLYRRHLLRRFFAVDYCLSSISGLRGRIE